MKAFTQGVVYSNSKRCAISYSMVHPHLPFVTSASNKKKQNQTKTHKKQQAKAKAAVGIGKVREMTMRMVTNKSEGFS